MFAQPQSEPFHFDIYAAASFSGAFDFDSSYSLIETSDESLSSFIYYDQTGQICDLKTEFYGDGSLKGWNIYDSWGSCDYAANGWTYTPIFYDREGRDLENILFFVGPDW